MKAKYFLIMAFFCVLTFSILAESEWSEPIGISSLTTGWDVHPVLKVDSQGVLHCVWANSNGEQSWLYYSKSLDEGNTWSTAYNLTPESSVFVGLPDMDIDSQDNLYLIYSYDYLDVQNVTQIHMKIFNGQSWSEPIIVTEEQPGAGYYYNNKIIIDNNDRIYFFWYNTKLYYRYYENDEFSDIKPIYDELPSYSTLVSIKIDNEGSFHGVGKTFENNQVFPVYYKYDGVSWLAPEIVYPRPGNEGTGRDIIPERKIHLVIWDGTAEHDGTIYKYKENNEWSLPDLINEDPLEQKLVIDNRNRKHVFEKEKLEQGSQLVYYYSDSTNIWEGNILDTSEHSVSDFNPVINKNQLYLIYYNYLDVLFMKKTLSDSTDIIPHINSFYYKLSQNFPNPCNPNTTINFSLNKGGNTILKILNVKGQLVKTLLKDYRKKGEYTIQWDGKDEKRREVASGVYYYRLQVDNKVRTRSLTLIK